MAVETIFDESYKFEIGKGVVLADGTDVTIVATGLMVGEALKAKAILAEKGIQAAVLNMPTIKPIDKELLVQYSKKTGAMVTTEEHSIIGGLGSAVCEALADEAPCIVLRHGVQDTFGKSGPAQKVLDAFGLNAENIAKYAEKAVALKK